MRLNPSDKILANIKQIAGQNVHAETTIWVNVSDLIIHVENTGRELYPGQDVVVEIDYIDNETAHATAIRAPYSRHLWPGDSVEVTPAYFSSNGLAVADYSDRTVSKIHVVDAVPEETVSVRISKISDEIAIGKVERRVSSGLKVGDELVATVESGTAIGKPEDGMFEIQLNSKAIVREEITIRITELARHVQASIIDPGVLPVPGNKIDMKVKRRSTQAVVPEPEYSVELLQPSLITGLVTVEIESHSDESEPIGQIISYNGQLPEVGQTVRAVSRVDEIFADPQDGTYRLVLDETTPVATEIGVDIYKIEDHVEGRIVDPGALPKPKNKVEGQVKRGSLHAVVTGPDYSVELLQPSLITGDVTVTIESTRNDDTIIGRIMSYRGQIPEVWDTIQAVTRIGQNIANPLEGAYEIVVDKTTPAAVEVDIWITEVGEQIEGEIVDYGRMPISGREINANVIINKSMATVPDSYDVKLDSPSLASGSAVVKILSVPDSVYADTVTGEIASYGDSLPSSGETIRAKIDGINSVAKPTTGRYEIQLSDVGERHGTGIVKITKVDENVRGEIVEMDHKNSNSKTRNPFSSSKNDLISEKKL